MVKEKSLGNLIVLLTSIDDKKLAEDLSNNILKKKLAACISLNEIQSTYWWEDEIQISSEIQLTIKTTFERSSILIEEIRKIHPYENPEFLLLRASSSIDYEKWVNNTVNS